MTCPECGEDNRDSAERCTSCNHALALAVGTVLAARYEIKSMLGVGGLGRVYRAHDRMLDEMVAVKVLHAEAARSAEMSKRFRSEIKLARKVRHKNVCAIHEYGEHEGSRFVAMELVDGIDLHRVLRKAGRLPPKEAFDISMQVAKGLAAIHEAGVIHRDLKTPNIMRDSRGDVRLLDFGIAKLISPTDTVAVTAVQKVVGTPEYMSPEQIRGDDLDERSDIYGLGVVIYELFTGKVPFQGKSALDTLLMHMSTPPPLYGEAASRLVPSVVPVLARCLAKSPAERYRTARDLLDALRAARDAALPGASKTPQAIEARSVATPPRRVTPIGAPPTARPATPFTPAAGAAAPLTPPIGPPRRPQRVAPPLPTARGAATRAEARLPAPATPAVPATPSVAATPPAATTPPAAATPPVAATPPGAATPPAATIPPVAATSPAATIPPAATPPAAATPPVAATPTVAATPPGAMPPGAGWGAGLALIGLAATVGAWLWLHYRPVDRPAEKPTVVATHPTPATSPAPSAPAPAGAQGTTAPDGTASPLPASPSPATEETRVAPVPATPESGVAAPRRRPASPSPTPTPTPVPTSRPAPTTGSLELAVKPSANVQVDGRDAGPAPLTSLEVAPGVRVLRLTHPDYWPLTRRVSVVPGKTLHLDVDLSWEGVARSRSKEPPFSAGIDGSPSDPYFARGLHQLAQGDFQEAILTLEPVARRLEQAGKEKDLARAQFYLGIALLELNRQSTAKERFAMALDLDSSLRVTGAAFSPKITSFFATVKGAASAKKKP